MKITKRQLKRIIKEEKAKLLNEASKVITADMIDAGPTEFVLADEYGEFDINGDLLDPTDLRKLADILEALYSGRPVPHQVDENGNPTEKQLDPDDDLYVGFSVD